jgi:chorismate-pyruvate lyase
MKKIEFSQRVRDEVKKGFNLKPIHRIILTTDGSVTRVIEAYTEKPVKIKTEMQRITRADKKVSSLLDIEEGKEVNYRVVRLYSNSILFAIALSLTPIDRLDEKFRDDLMRADIPIGKLLEKYKIEARREINWIRICMSDEIELERNNFNPGEVILSRNYNIIHRGKILMNITEYFPSSVLS